MRRFIAFIILLIHVNTSMFIPVMDEVDIYDVHGNQVGDINTVVEYIDQVVLGHKPQPHPDSDDDQAHFFNLMKLPQFIANPVITFCAARPTFIIAVKPAYKIFREERFSSVIHDVLAPPPKV